MIKRVFGYLNGQEITLVQRDLKLWDVEIPKVKEGKYIVEIFAEDEAGNISFFAKVFFEINANCTCVNFKMMNYDLETENSECKESCDLDIHLKNYDLEVVSCECL